MLLAGGGVRGKRGVLILCGDLVGKELNQWSVHRRVYQQVSHMDFTTRVFHWFVTLGPRVINIVINMSSQLVVNKLRTELNTPV